MASTSPFVPGDGQQTPSIQPLALFHAPGRTNPPLLQGRLFLVFYHYSYDYNLHSHSRTRWNCFYPFHGPSFLPWDWKNCFFFNLPGQRGWCQSLGAGKGVVRDLGKWTPLVETHFPGVWICCSQRALNGTTPTRVNVFTSTSRGRGTELKRQWSCRKSVGSLLGAAGFDVGFLWEAEWGPGVKERLRPCTVKKGALLIISVP